ncbi:MAG: penicillin acylase family protein [Beijerinckiaceae bacterium]|nr:penicillin acylase family protein [Beijerinckiaceae bacterium]
MHTRLRRTLWVLPAAAIAITGSLLYYSFKAPLPAERRTHDLVGLSAEVHIEFDELGIPHISAANAADAYHALGFVTARDRLFQMDLLRRGTAGRLAEIFGGGLLEEDRWNRVLGFNQLASVTYSRLPDAQRRLLEAYAAGVNQAMAAARMFPVEFTFLGYKPELWRPEDSVLVMLAMHSLLSWSGDQERTATVMRRALPRSVVDFLTPESDCYNEMLAPRSPARCAPGALPLADLIAVTSEASGAEEADQGIVSAAGRPRGSNRSL